jgi:hypothetical protein
MIYVLCLFHIGVLAFLLFTEKLPMIAYGPTSLNYYWVPLLVRAGGDSAGYSVTKILYSGYLKQQKFIPHSFVGWDVQDQSINPLSS